MKKILVFTVIFLLFYATASYCAWVDADGIGQESIDVTNNTVNSQFPSLRLDSAQNPHIAWINGGSWGEYGDVSYLKWNGAAWVDADGTGQESASMGAFAGSLGEEFVFLLLDNAGKPHITWYDRLANDKSEIYYLKWDGANWVDVDGSGQESENIYPFFGLSAAPYLCLNNSGAPRIAWFYGISGGPTQEIYYEQWNGSQWVDVDGTGLSNLDVSHTNKAWIPRMCLDNSGNPHIAWIDQTPGVGHEQVFYLQWNGTVWVDADGTGQESINISNTSGQAWNPSLSLDASGNPHIAWADTLGLCYLQWNGSEWVDADGTGRESMVVSATGGSPSLCLDGSGNPHIAWAPGNSDVYYLKWNGSAWVDVDGTGQEAMDVSNNNGNSKDPSLVLDGLNNPHIAWSDDTSGNSDIYYLWWDPAAATMTDTPSATPACTFTATSTITETGTMTATRTIVTPTFTSALIATPTRTPVPVIPGCLRLDPDFNGSGFLVYNGTADGDDTGNAVVMDDAGRIIVVGSISSAASRCMAIWRYNPDGSPDTTFNGTGHVMRCGSAGYDYIDQAQNVCIDGDGKILVSGFGYGPPPSPRAHMMIWRYNPDGSPDTTFNGTGCASFLTGTAAAGNSIVTDGSGKILVTGSCNYVTNMADMAVWRYNPDGTIDATFNGTGYVIHNGAAGGNFDDMGNEVRVDGSGKIIVAGYSTNPGSQYNHDLAVWKFNPDGSFDAGFNGIGYVVRDMAGLGYAPDAGLAMTIDMAGKIVVAGQSQDNTYTVVDMMLWRFNQDGSQDASFNDTGFVKFNAGPVNNSSGSDVVIDGNGKILVTGAVDAAVTWNPDATIWRYNNDGTPDTTFNASGYVIHGNAAGGDGPDRGFGIITDSSGRIITAGISANTANLDMAIWQYEERCDTPTVTATVTQTVTPTITATPTATPTVSFTLTFTYTATFKPSPTISATVSVSPSLTFTGTPTQTFTFTLTGTVTPTVTCTPTMTCTFTLTPTFTPYPAGEIRIYPNPVGIDSGKKLKFGNLFPGSSVCIYTLSGEFVTGINSQGGLAVWDMMNNWHSRVSPGIYYYVIKNPINNKIFTGKIFVTAH